MSKSWQDVVDSYEKRWEIAGTNMETTLVGRLNAICDAYAEGESRCTLALGVIGDTLVIGIQGSVNVTPNEVLAVVNEKCGLALKNVYVADKATVGVSSAGYHAEMLIIKYCVENLNLATSDTVSTLGGKLSVATTKGCCIHCAYYLGKHGIKHTNTSGKFSTGQAKPQYAPVDGPGMGTWFHPFTGAKWMQVVGGKQWEYKKGQTEHHKA